MKNIKNIKTFIALAILFLIPTLSLGQNKIERSNVASAIYGSRAEVVYANGEKVSADKVIDGNYDDASSIKMEGVPATLTVEFPIPVQINLVRIFPGMTIYAPNPSGDCGIKDYHIEGYNNGYWHPLVKAENQPDYLNSKAEGNATYFFEHNFRPTTASAVRIVVTRSGHTGRSASSKDIIPEEKRISFIREFEVYEAGKNSAFGKAFYFNSVVGGDFRLPVYRRQSQAGLVLNVSDNINTPSLPVIVTVVPEHGGETIEEREINLVPGTQTVLFDLSLYSNGRYVVNLAPKDKNSIYKGAIRRMLRIDRGGFATLPAEPIQVLGQKIFPVDDFHFVEREGVESFVKPVDQVIQASRPLAPDRPVQNALGSAALNYDSQGNFVMYFNDANRMGGDKKYHYAYSKDLITWQIADESPTGVPNKSMASPYKLLPPSAIPRWSEKTKLSEASVVFYDKDRDGVPPLNEVRIQWFPPTLCDATQYGLIQWGTYPVWEKRQGEWLVLTRDPLIVDKFQFDPDEFEAENSSNDNFGPQYLSDDGKTLYFSRAAKVRRFTPYTIEYDNTNQVYRIMRTHYSHDGINWQVRYLALPEESDHWSYQHYGVHTFRVDKNYYIGYLHAYHCTKQQIYTEIIYSRDGLNWNRFPDSEAFIPNGPMGSWTSGMIFTQTNPIELNGKYYLPLSHVFKSLHFYVTRGREDISFVNAEYLCQVFSGRNLVEQWPYFEEIGGWEGLAEDMHNDHASVGLAVFRKDGWISSRASSVGSMLSRIFTAPNASLKLNADTGTGGEIKIEVLHPDGTPIDSYCGANAALYKGDGTDVVMKWNKGAISVLPEFPFRLRISMEKSEIYSLEFIKGVIQKDPSVYYEQDFEDNTFFSNLSVNGYTVNTDSANGYWGTIKPDANGDYAVCISDEIAHSGLNSIKVTRRATNYFASCVFKNALPVSGLSTFKFWAYRPTGSEFSCVLSGVNASSSKVDLALIHTAETGRFFIRNNSLVNTRTHIPMPADTWVLLRFELNWENNTIVFSYEKDGVRTAIGELELVGGGAIKIDRFHFGAGVSPAGSANYFDDVKISYYSNDSLTNISSAYQVSDIFAWIENNILTISSIDPIRNISVYNMNGMLVLHKNDTQSVQVDCLPKGLYLVEVQDVKGKTVRRKVMK